MATSLFNSVNVAPNPNDSNAGFGYSYGRTLVAAGSNTTISNPLITSTSVILLSWEYVSGTPSFLQVTSKTAGTSFVVNVAGAPGAGTGYINWYIPQF
jgi:hypothetical protein